MKGKTLYLHIGSPKTGTTAIQGFLQANTDVLGDSGVNYVQAGRTNIAHNSMVSAFKKGKGDKVCAAIANEVAASNARVHVMSSEMFFRPGTAGALGAGFPDDLRAITKVVCYIRRQDKYLEALYKQLVKNGRTKPDAMQFHDRRLESLAYSRTLDAYAQVFGARNMIVRPFERRQIATGDVVDDFIQHTGIEIVGDVAQVDPATNKTLSAPVSEMLGMLKQQTDLNTRDLIRVLIRQNDAGAVMSDDVYDLPTRRAIFAHHGADNDRVRDTYCRDLDTLFDATDLEAGDDPYPDSAQQVENWRAAAQAMTRAIGAAG